MQLQFGKEKSVARIAVLRAGSLGDLLVSIPALNALRRAYPSAEIVLLGCPWMKRFDIEKRTVIDRLVIVPVMKGIREEKNKTENKAETDIFFEFMQQECFDLAISFHGNGNSANPFLQRLNATRTIGLKSNTAAPLDRNMPFYYYQNEQIRYMEVVQMAGAVATELEPSINVLQKDMQETMVLRSSVTHPYIIIHPMAIDIRRSWPAKKFAALADALAAKEYNIIFTGSEDDNNNVEEICRLMQCKAINTSGKFSLGGVAALMQEAVLVIGSDTGPLHLARAVATPTIGLYWAPNLVNWAPLTRSLHHPVVSWQMHCPLCGVIPNDPYPFEPKNNCNHAVSFIENISVEEVLQAVAAVLHEDAASIKQIPDITV